MHPCLSPIDTSNQSVITPLSLTEHFTLGHSFSLFFIYMNFLIYMGSFIRGHYVNK